ncbi:MULTISPECIES: thioredoxin-dependent thiol peroxidase [Microbacterium]|uniref:thioredoxin-dependent thiol peroxidase n=1 Tax=Microbacterium TaxID=33882 RepID=UPI0012B77864|nr:MULTISPECIES: thioredoxin-dependent thiol peroxidase [Microbacterium]MTE23378.1 thioredoxin-dependent thiol peroxidase [Microbacterium sp. ZXX196]NHI17914.1 thioredoxin-dependent thiol peroxidase [Microbacterium excoecariae]
MTDIRLAAGDPAPDFTLPDQDGRPVSLASFRGRRVVAFFYPAAMTPGCTTEACDFRDALEPLRAAGYDIVGISRDEPEKLRRFADRDGLTYPLLSDPDAAVHRAYGAWGEKMNYGKKIEGVIRSTFAIDEEGRVALAAYNVKATGHVGRIRRDLGIA